MALIARVSGESQELYDWSEDPADIEPVTSRSPSFVRIKVEGERSSGHASIEECVTESSPPPASEPSPISLPIDDASLIARAAERAIELEIRTMQLEDTSRHIDDARLHAAVRCLLADVAEVDSALQAKALPPVLVHHVYEWASNVVAQTEERLAPVQSGERASSAASTVSIGLSVAEYSSLFVRAILEPMIAEAIARLVTAKDARGAEDLRALSDRIMWLNWTLKRELGS